MAMACFKLEMGCEPKRIKKVAVSDKMGFLSSQFGKKKLRVN